MTPAELARRLREAFVSTATCQAAAALIETQAAELADLRAREAWPWSMGGVWRVLYTNHEGRTEVRQISVDRVRFGRSDWHAGCQWIVHGLDVDRFVTREFALKDMRPVPSPPTTEDGR